MRVVVLMSTYQGERWVAEQIRSILDQLPPEGRLVVRDDGSRDGTPACVEAIGDPRITLERGANLGFVRSFQALLAGAPPDAEMTMLSDQDDIWLPGKVQRAWEVVAPSADTPTLYCSRLQLVDEQLKPLGLSPEWGRPPCFENALTENIVTGCTVALNPAALRLVSQCGDASRIYFHDWWFYLVVAAFGRVVFDPEPTILYRQHSYNAIGMGAGLERYLTILRFVRHQSWTHIMFNQIENFRDVFGQRLEPRERRLIDRLFDPHSALSMLRLLLTPLRMRQTLVGDLLFRGMVVADVVTGRGLLPKARRTGTQSRG
jgi:glycosyltransferase involved in cell wall biosynthesis